MKLRNARLDGYAGGNRRQVRAGREGRVVIVQRWTMRLAAVALAVLPLAVAQGADFKIGAILPLTGPGADIGRFLVEGAKAVVVLANERGGIGGMHVDLIVCDTQSAEQQAVLCMRKLAYEDKVDLVLGAGTTPQTQAILPTIAQAGIPTFAIAGGTLNFRPLKKWVFKALPTNEDQIPVALEYLKAKGAKRIAVIRDNGPFGSDVAANLKPAVAKMGMTLVADELYAPTDTDMSAQVTRIREAKPDAIFDMSSNPPPGAIIAKKIYQLGMKQPIIVGPNLQTKAFADLSGQAAAQEIFIGLKATVAPESGNDPLAANFKAFAAAFRKVDPKAEVVALSATCADAVILTQDVGKKIGAKVLNHAALLKGLESLHHVPGIQGYWTFSPTSHETSLASGIALIKYDNGHWVPAT